MATDSAEPTAALDIRLLGPLDVSSDGRPVPLPTGRLPALLAVLAMSAGQSVSAERLATAVWGEDLAVDARANVQTNVKRLRRLIGADRITTRGHGYALNVDPDRVDALRFERLLEAAAAADRPAQQRELLDDALRLWRGAPFEGIASDWLAQAPTARLQERYLAAIERRTDLDLADESRTDVAELAAALVAVAPAAPRTAASRSLGRGAGAVRDDAARSRRGVGHRSRTGSATRTRGSARRSPSTAARGRSAGH